MHTTNQEVHMMSIESAMSAWDRYEVSFSASTLLVWSSGL